MYATSTEPVEINPRSNPNNSSPITKLQEKSENFYYPKNYFLFGEENSTRLSHRVNTSISARLVVPTHNNKASQQPHLFSSFAFKGIAFSIAKSINDWTSMLVGIKIPITPNFPVYDSRIYLPRVNAFIGVAFPASVRLSLTLSVPTQAFVGSVLLALRGAKQPFFQWPLIKPTQSIKRIGITLSCRLGGKHGIKSTMGFLFMFLPGLSLVNTLLPMIILFPALVLSTIQLLQNLFDSIDTIANKVLSYFGTCLFSKEQKLSKNRSYCVLNSIQSEQLGIHAGHTNSSSPKNNADQSRACSFLSAWATISDWMDTKSSVFTYTLSRSHCFGCGASTGHSVQYDLQPFYPFQRYFAKLTKKARAKIKERSNVTAKKQSRSVVMNPADSTPII